MENVENSTESSRRVLPRIADSTHGGGNAYLYILVVMTFYGVFLCGIMLGYFHSKRREKRRSNVFTRLVHEEEQREWGALPKRHGVAFPGAAVSVHVSMPFCGNHGNHAVHPHPHPHPHPHLHPHHYEGALPSPLACALCTEQSSVSSLCSSADARFAIEEESDSGTAEGPEEAAKPGGGAENSGEESG